MKSFLWLAAALLALVAGCRSSNGPSPEHIPSPAQPPGIQNSASEDRSPALQIRGEIGFASKRKFLDHFDKHGAEFGSISSEEYLRQAQILRDRPAGGDVLEYKRDDGVITRFDRKTGAFIAFNPDLVIRTFFKPNDGERYFHRQSRR